MMTQRNFTGKISRMGSKTKSEMTKRDDSNFSTLPRSTEVKPLAKPLAIFTIYNKNLCLSRPFWVTFLVFYRANLGPRGLSLDTSLKIINSTEYSITKVTIKIVCNLFTNIFILQA
jgi:hypothetical protein